MSQVVLAKKLHISKQSVSNWENDNIVPSVEMLSRLALALDVSTDWLLELDDRDYLEVSNLPPEQLAHIQMLIDDLRSCGCKDK